MRPGIDSLVLVKPVAPELGCAVVSVRANPGTGTPSLRASTSILYKRPGRDVSREAYEPTSDTVLGAEESRREAGKTMSGATVMFTSAFLAGRRSEAFPSANEGTNDDDDEDDEEDEELLEAEAEADDDDDDDDDDDEDAAPVATIEG